MWQDRNLEEVIRYLSDDQVSFEQLYNGSKDLQKENQYICMDPKYIFKVHQSYRPVTVISIFSVKAQAGQTIDSTKLTTILSHDNSVSRSLLTNVLAISQKDRIVLIQAYFLLCIWILTGVMFQMLQFNSQTSDLNNSQHFNLPTQFIWNSSAKIILIHLQQKNLIQSISTVILSCSKTI